MQLCMYVCVYVSVCMSECLYGRMDGWRMDGRMDGWMEGWMAGSMDHAGMSTPCKLASMLTHSYSHTHGPWVRARTRALEASQVVDAAIAALGSALGVDPSAVEVQVTQSARRLAQAKKATGRRLAISWSVVYQVLVSADAAASVSEAARAQRADLGAFRAILAPELEAVGVSMSSVSSLAILDFAEVSVEITELGVALAMLNTTSDPDPAAEDSDIDGLDNLTLQERRLSTITGTRSLALGWFRELFAKALLGDDNVTVPPETSIGNYTHFLVYTASGLAEQTTPAAGLQSRSVAVTYASLSDLPRGINNQPVRPTPLEQGCAGIGRRVCECLQCYLCRSGSRCHRRGRNHRVGSSGISAWGVS